MIEPNQFEKGMAINYKGEPHVILEYEFYKPGKGGAFTRTKLKNLKTGATVSNTFPSGERVEQIDVQYLQVSFLYDDDENCYFMDENFEQFQVPNSIVSDRKKYLKEEGKVDGIFIEGDLTDVRLPKNMKFKVTEAPEGVKGDTANNPTKQITIETGAILNVPLFIKKDEIIVINTENGEYVSRVNE
ncbi:MAG: elongation factor P [Patescibacteria group bacterium]